MANAPTLEELKARACTQEELQAALIVVIEHHNALTQSLQEMLNSGRIRSSHEALMNTPFGL